MAARKISSGFFALNLRSLGNAILPDLPWLIYYTVDISFSIFPNQLFVL